MTKKLNLMDLKILDGLATYGPRNISETARKLGLKPDTLRKRLQRLSSRIFLRFRANVYCPNLGLKKAVVIAEAICGHENLLFDSLKTNDFWIYLARCYGANEGCIAYYTVPTDNSSDFEEFVHMLEESGVARNLRTYWSTCFQGVNARAKWFDEKSQDWLLAWDEWVEEVPNEKVKLPRTLIDPAAYSVDGDEIDVFVLKELEKNPRIALDELAKTLGVSRQVAQYHYEKHVLEKGLLEGFDIFTLHFGTSTADLFVFVFEFDTEDKSAKFASSLLDKPFVGGIGKVLNRNSLIVDIYLPRAEFRKFIHALGTLVREGLLTKYSYIILDLAKTQRQTISYEYFKKGSWIYDHDKHIRNLKQLADDLLRSFPSKLT